MASASSAAASTSTTPESNESNPLDTLSPSQYKALVLATEARKSVFITGPGGTGKSFVVKAICATLADKGVQYALTSTTGVSALLLKGSTIYEYMKLGIMNDSLFRTVTRVKKSIDSNFPTFKHLKTVQTIIIDEISMLPARIFHVIDHVLRTVRNKLDKPFGGVQIIGIGDFFQLPAIQRGDVDPETMDLCKLSAGALKQIHEHYKTPEEILTKYNPLIFETELWTKTFPKKQCIVLTTPFRQIDRTFFDILCRIRKGTMTDHDIKCLQEASSKHTESIAEKEGIGITRLAPLKHEVETINRQELDKLKAQGSVLTNIPLFIQGDPESQVKFDKERLKHLDDQKMKLAKQLDLETYRKAEYGIGAQLMLTYNLSPKNGLVNGTQCVLIGWATPTIAAKETGTTPDKIIEQEETIRESLGIKDIVYDFTEEPNLRGSWSAWIGGMTVPQGITTFTPPIRSPVVRYVHEGVVLEVCIPHVGFIKTIPGLGKVSAGYCPLIPAWAVTVHKAQGATLDRVSIDLSSSFEFGQAYVALSRAKTMDGLLIKGLDAKVVKSDPRCVWYYKSIE